MAQELLNLLSYFGGGRPGDVAVRFLLAAFFWGILALVSWREWRAARDRKDRFVCIAALIGLSRELLMFAAEYGGMRGFLQFDSLHRFYPPFEHAATMLSGIFISTAFINYLGKKHASLAHQYFLTSVTATLFLYALTASLWPEYTAAHLGLGFGSFWGDMSFRVAACLFLGIAIAVFVLARIQGARVQGALLTALLLLFLDEFLMIFNLATAERHVVLFGPIRHNMHIWALPLFVGVYWSDQNHQLRKALRDIRSERLRSEAIIAAIADGITIQDRDFRILFQNQINKDLVGDHAGELCYQAYGKKDRQCYDCPISRTFEDGKVHHVQRTLMLNGSLRIIELTASPLRDSEGRIIAGIELVRDVTEKKRLQDEDIKAQKLESVGLLAGGLAHDFNNMLTTIYGNIGLAKLSIGDDHEASEQLEAAERAALRATGVTRQLLTFAKGGAPLKKVSLIADLIRESVAFTLSGSAVKAEFITADHICPVDVDPGQMSQVFNNLTLNALQAMPNGGTIRIAIDTVRVPDPAPPLVPGEYVRIVVSDTGIGIPEDLQLRIFDPYFTTKQKGNGLGLTTVHSIIKKHDGSISVESQPGKGTSFQIFLPASKASAPAISEEVRDITGGRGPVLIMDDEPDIRETAGAMLTKLGYDCSYSADGQEALSLYQRAHAEGKPYILVIMDITVPGGMGGKEAMQKLLEIDPQAKGIVSSGYSNDPVMADHAQYGFSGVIAKPYSISELDGLVRRVLSAPKGTDSR